MSSSGVDSAILGCSDIHCQIVQSKLYITIDLDHEINASIEVIALDSDATSMPQGKHVRPRINFALSDKSKEELEQWAKDDHRTVSNLVEALTEEALKTKQIRSSTSISTDDLDQLKKFVALLLGERKRDGVSFVLLGQALDLDPEKLHKLYLLVQECRIKEKSKK